METLVWPPLKNPRRVQFCPCLKINVKNPEAAKYVESAIAKKDLNALFLFESSNDMHTFITEMREKRGDRKLVVHAAKVPNNSVSEFVAPYSIDELK
jgi:hypothetical protein